MGFFRDLTEGVQRAVQTTVNVLTTGNARGRGGFLDSTVGRVARAADALARTPTTFATEEDRLRDEKEQQAIRARMFMSMANPTGARGLGISASNQMGLIGSMRPQTLPAFGTEPKKTKAPVKPTFGAGGSAQPASSSRNSLL